MRVLLITPVFHPEPYYLRGLPFARELVRRGIEVEVLTGFPNYPEGRLMAGYRQSFCLRECVDGVGIIRVPHYISHDRSGLRRAFSYLTLALSMGIQGPFRVRPPDLVHVNQGHATLCLPADWIGLTRRAPCLLDIQDLWPESVLDSRMLRVPGGRRLLELFCRCTYRRARHIVTLSDGVKRRLMARGVPGAKVSVLHNWCDAALEQPLPPRDCAPDPHGLRGRFNVVYAGNIGPLQALDIVLDAAALLRDPCPDARFVLVGSGLDEARLRRAAAGRALDNVLFVARQPVSQLNGILAHADATLVHLRDSPLNRVGIPSKVQHSLAIGRPILIGATGSAAAMVRRARAGIVFEPENARQLADAVREIRAMTPDERETIGEHGRAYYLAHMSFDVGITKLIDLYRHTAGIGPAD